MPSTHKSVFTPAEIEYLKSQRLCRIATVGPDGQPHVVPVSFRYNTETDTIDIGGHFGFAKRKKWRDIQHNPRVAVVIDDIVSLNPWKVRGIEVRGTVEVLATGGETVVPGFDPEMFRITPKRIASWGLETEFRAAPNARSVN
jgi:pyridoxamine 5'-phosphate oxidase family protein